MLAMWQVTQTLSHRLSPPWQGSMAAGGTSHGIAAVVALYAYATSENATATCMCMTEHILSFPLRTGKAGEWTVPFTCAELCACAGSRVGGAGVSPSPFLAQVRPACTNYSGPEPYIKLSAVTSGMMPRPTQWYSDRRRTTDLFT